MPRSPVPLRGRASALMPPKGRDRGSAYSGEPASSTGGTSGDTSPIVELKTISPSTSSIKIVSPARNSLCKSFSASGS